MTVKTGDVIEAIITYTNLSTGTLTCDTVFVVYNGNYVIAYGYVKGRNVNSGASDTVDIISVGPVPDASYPKNTYYDLLVVIGKNYNPNTGNIDQVYATLTCPSAVYYSV